MVFLVQKEVFLFKRARHPHRSLICGTQEEETQVDEATAGQYKLRDKSSKWKALLCLSLSPCFLNFKIYLYLFKFLLLTLLQVFPKEGYLKINLSIINKLPSFPFWAFVLIDGPEEEQVWRTELVRSLWTPSSLQHPQDIQMEMSNRQFDIQS